jgi:hypothetical protein
MLLLQGCNTAPERIEPLSADKVKYAEFDCDRLLEKERDLHRQVARLQGKMDDVRSVTGGVNAIVAWVVFWPELIDYHTVTSKEDEAEHARLLGEVKTVRGAAAAKRCVNAGPDQPDR